MPESRDIPVGGSFTELWQGHWVYQWNSSSTQVSLLIPGRDTKNASGIYQMLLTSSSFRTTFAFPLGLLRHLRRLRLKYLPRFF